MDRIGRLDRGLLALLDRTGGLQRQSWFAFSVRESDADLARLQQLLNRSYATSGHHLLSIHTPARRLDARQVTERLMGMCLLALATVTGDGRPIIGPVDRSPRDGCQV